MDGTGTYPEDAVVPARILVKGCSTAVWVAPPSGGRTDFVFSRWLEALLPARGLQCVVRNAGVHAEQITEAMCRWGDEIEGWSPDVVVLNYGVIESLPKILPRPLHRHVHSWHRHAGGLRHAYRAKLVDPVWRTALRRFQRFVDGALGPAPARVSPGRMKAELVHFVRQTRQVGSPLVLVLDVWDPGPLWQHWMPGSLSRARRHRSAMAEAVEEFGEPDVRLLRASDVVHRHPADFAIPDGVHLSPTLHRELAEMLAGEILSWARGQPHLSAPRVEGPTDGVTSGGRRPQQAPSTAGLSATAVDTALSRRHC
jgi:hypothetical protein